MSLKNEFALHAKENKTNENKTINQNIKKKTVITVCKDKIDYIFSNIKQMYITKGLSCIYSSIDSFNCNKKENSILKDKPYTCLYSPSHKSVQWTVINRGYQ